MIISFYPLTYRGYTLTWQNGRQLASMQLMQMRIEFTKTRLYYLKSSYYDPAVKRFVNGVMYSFYISEKNSLKSINVSKENPYYLSVNRILFSKKPLKVLCIPGVYYLE